MLEATLFRYYFPEHTLGWLCVGGEVFCTIERAWADNKSNVSCIPPGTYTCKYLERSASGKYRQVYWLQNVPGRSGILIHNGNYAWHSTGCIILGMKHGSLGGNRAVLSSRTAMRKLREVVGEQYFKLEIIGDTP